jgi:hypothetical protein
MTTYHDLELEPELPFETGITLQPATAAAAAPLFRGWRRI